MIRIKNFLKSAGRFLKSILPAFLFFTSLLFAFSMPVFAASSGAIVETKPSFSPAPSAIPGDLSISEAYEIINKGISGVLALYGLTESSVEASFYDMMYEKLITDECHLSYNKGDTAPNEYSGKYCLYSSPGVWNEDYLQYFVLTLSSSWIYYDVNTFLDYARARLAAEHSASQFNDDDYVQKTPISIESGVFTDVIPTLNNKYYPKNSTGKMSYRTDERWHNMYDGSTTGGGWWYDQLDLYTGNFGFSALGGDDMYMIFFARSNNTDWYGKYQYHLYVTTNDVWYDDRDEIEYTDYTLNYEYWDNIDGSQEQSVKGVLYSGGNHYFDLSLASNFQIGAFSDIQAYTTGFRFNHLNSGSFSLSDYKTVYSTDLQQFIALPYTHFADSLDFHSTKCSNEGCDVGYYASLSPISTVYNIDTTRIPEDHYITVSGDTIYDYSITNPVTGDTTTISNYITNNYNFPPKDDNDTSGSGTSGNVTVSGQIDVSGTVSVDVNVDVNINGNGGGGGGNSYEMPDTSFFDDYLDDALKESSGIRKFIADFFDSMPGQITKLICFGLVLAILCRLIGR